jgi:hypothetical protein
MKITRYIFNFCKILLKTISKERHTDQVCLLNKKDSVENSQHPLTRPPKTNPIKKQKKWYLVFKLSSMY